MVFKKKYFRKIVKRHFSKRNVLWLLLSLHVALILYTSVNYGMTTTVVVVGQIGQTFLTKNLNQVGRRHTTDSMEYAPAIIQPEMASSSILQTEDFPRRRKKKRILFWTDFYGRKKGLTGFCLSEDRLERHTVLCKNVCEFTVDRSLLGQSDAVVFHNRDLKVEKVLESDGTFKLGPTKMPQRGQNFDQLWIYLAIDPPVYGGRKLLVNQPRFLTPFSNLFNWTMSYRSDSDVHIPYGLIRSRSRDQSHSEPWDSPFKKMYQPKLPTEDEIRKLAHRPKMVAWIVSNCYNQQSRRMDLQIELQKFVPIDVHGGCGPFKCLQGNGDFCENPLGCYMELASLYKFYLVFENSLCVDYVTEKIFNALTVGMVPIVYGHGNYSQHVPAGSYIDVNWFDSAHDLADHLLMLDQNEEAYLKYFEWTQKFYVEDIFYIERAWCSLCNKLSQFHGHDEQQMRVVTYLDEWWFKKTKKNESVCVEPKAKF